MAWQSLSLDNVFSGLKTSLDRQKKDAGKLLKKGSLVLGGLQAKVDALNSIMSSNASTASRLSESGIHTLYLAPGKGDWAARAQNEPGAPADAGYSAGALLVVTGPDAAVISQKYRKIIEALAAPL